MHPDKIRLEATLAHIDKLLHSGEYTELERLSDGERLTAVEIQQAIDEYPEELAPRPEYCIETTDIVYISGSKPAEWSVYLHLWRKEGGVSDLTVELTLIDSNERFYGFQIDNILVQ